MNRGLEHHSTLVIVRPFDGALLPTLRRKQFYRAYSAFNYVRIPYDTPRGELSPTFSKTRKMRSS